MLALVHLFACGTAESLYAPTGDPPVEPAENDTAAVASDTGSDADTSPPAPARDDTAASGGDSFNADTGVRQEEDPAPPPVDPAVLVGRTYAFDLSTSTIAAPAGMGSVLAGWLENQLVVQVLAADGRRMSLRWGWTEAGGPAQDTCMPTTEAIADFTDNPRFETAPSGGSLRVIAPMHAESAVLSGTFANEGRRVEHARLTMLAEVTPLAAEFGLESGAELCDLFGSMGAACEPCADGSATCLRFSFEEVTGEPVSSPPLVGVETGCE